MTTLKTGIVSHDRAWAIAGKLSKSPPYRGYALDLGNGQLLVCRPDGQFEVRDEVKPSPPAVPTMESLQSEVRAAGFTVSSASWEDEHHIYAFSKETMREHWGHPEFAASYHKDSGWLSIDGKPPVKVS